VLLLVGVVVGATAGGFAVVRATSGSSSASSFVPVSPVRVLDTRSDLGLAEVTDGVAGTLKVTGSIPTATTSGVVNAVVVPAGATAVVLNVTAVNPTAGGYVSLRPGDATGAPTVSTLNVTAGGTFPNGATITIPTTGAHAGEIQVWYEAEYTTVGSTELLIDIAGYYELASSGPAGATGPAGADGVDATVAITQQSVCDGNDADTTADELCKIGMTGPGGGLIFFVDYNDQYADFNYLEAAPASCEVRRTWSSANTAVTAVRSWAARAVGQGKANTTAILAVFTTDTASNNAAQYAFDLANGVPGGCVTSKDDWFLGSLGEMKLMYDNLQGLGGFSVDWYWNSTEYADNFAFVQNFSGGYSGANYKSNAYPVRPVRAFGGTLALACADGGVCAVGDTGPGGGKVFYVHPSGTFACGATLSSTCKYLEAAPTSGTAAWTDATYEWSGNTSEAIGADAQGTAIGTGYRNTQAMVTQSSTAGRAGTVSRAYRGPNSLSDWYLPSQDELNQMYVNKNAIGDFSTDLYWSSSEYGDDSVWVQDFSLGLQGTGLKNLTLDVRPVRAF
jgi:hypothetical protein